MDSLVTFSSPPSRAKRTSASPPIRSTSPRPKGLIASSAEAKVSKTANFSDELPQLRVRMRISIRPFPVADFGHVLAVIARVLARAQAGVGHELADVGGFLSETGRPVDDVHHEVIAVEVVHHDHVEG